MRISVVLCLVLLLFLSIGSGRPTWAQAEPTNFYSLTVTDNTSGARPVLTGHSVTLFGGVAASNSPFMGGVTGQTVLYLDGVQVASQGGSGGFASCSFTTTNLTVGTHILSASFLGDGVYQTCTSTASSPSSIYAAPGNVTFTVAANPDPSTTTSLTSAGNPSGGSVSLTATVSTASGSPTGRVQFFNGTLPLGSAVTLSGSFKATLSTTLAKGSYNISAQYSGDNNFQASTSNTVSQTVGLSPTVSIGNLSPGTTVVAGNSLKFDVSVTGSGGTPTGSVQIKDGSAVVATLTLSNGSVSYSNSTLAVGNHNFTAVYAGDANYNGATSAGKAVTVSQIPTSTTFATSNASAVSGEPITLTATVSATSGTPTGTVTFRRGNNVLGIESIDSNGVATLPVGGLNAGNYSFSATYGGAVSYATSSATLPQTVGKASTTAVLQSGSNPARFGAPVTFTVAVSANAPGVGTPGGTVQFTDGGTPLGQGVPLVAGTASFTPSSLASGPHAISVTYNGDANFSSTSSNTVSQLVGALTSLTLTSSADPGVLDSPITFTATVASATKGSIAGTVTFVEPATSTTFATVSLDPTGQATYTTSSLPIGTHTIVATYNGSAAFQENTGSVEQDITTKPTSVAVTSSANPSVGGQNVTLTAVVSSTSSGVPSGVVAFKEGESTLGAALLVNGRASVDVSALSVGGHSITAVYGGSASFARSQSGAFAQAVNPADTATALVASANPIAVGGSVTLTASVTVQAPGGTMPGGTVTFLDGTTILGTATVDSSGLATVTASALAVGAHSITAAYGGDSSTRASTSSAASVQVVSTPVTTVTVTSSNNTIIFGSSVTLTVTVGSSQTGLGTPTGSVTLVDGSTPIGTVTLSAGTGTLTLPRPGRGNRLITATYGGDGTFSGATGSLAQVVNSATASVALSSSANPAVFGNPVTFSAQVSSLNGVTPSGTVTFTSNGVTIGVATVDGSANATLTSTFDTTGENEIGATYSGDANFASATAVALEQDIGKASAITLVLDNHGITLKPGVAFTLGIKVIPPQGGFPDAVIFTCSGLPSGATYSFDPPSLPAGGKTGTTRLTITLAQAAAVPLMPLDWDPKLPLFACLFAACMIFLRVRKPQMRHAALASLLAVAVLLLASGVSGCGGGSSGGTSGGTSATGSSAGVSSSTSTGTTSQTIAATRSFPITISAKAGSAAGSETVQAITQ